MGDDTIGGFPSLQQWLKSKGAVHICRARAQHDHLPVYTPAGRSRSQPLFLVAISEGPKGLNRINNPMTYIRIHILVIIGVVSNLLGPLRGENSECVCQREEGKKKSIPGDFDASLLTVCRGNSPLLKAQQTNKPFSDSYYISPVHIPFPANERHHVSKPTVTKLLEWNVLTTAAIPSEIETYVSHFNPRYLQRGRADFNNNNNNSNNNHKRQRRAAATTGSSRHPHMVAAEI